MSWRDRPYSDDQGRPWSPYGQGMGFALPKPTRVVKYLLIINFAVFVLTAFSEGLRDLFFDYFSMMAGTGTPAGVLTGQIWRLVTYQYLHDISSPMHLLFNMLGLYFLGTPLERRWGTQTFFVFYTACGVAGAILFTVLCGVGFLTDGEMIGASGSVLGLLAACAVLMPEFVIILLFFPVPIRFAAVLFTGIYVLSLLSAFANNAPGAGGDAAHLGGMALGAAWCLWGWNWLSRHRESRQQGAWQRKLEKQEELGQEVDRILAKVHDHGIQSLTRREKRILADATASQNKQEQRTRRL